MGMNSFTGKAKFSSVMGEPQSVSANRFLRVMDILSFLFICLFCAECAVGSSGRWISIGPVSIRMVFFAAAFLCSLPLVWHYRQHLLKNVYLYILCAFILWLGVCAVTGYFNGNSTVFIKNDLTSFLTLALIPGAVLTLRNRARLYKLSDVLFYSSAALAIAVLVIHYTLPLKLFSVFHLNEVINQFSLGGLADIGFGVLRIYFRSQIFMQVTILIGIWKLVSNCKFKVIIVLLTGMMTFALILSFTRGFWMGFALGMTAFFILTIRRWRAYLKSICAVFCVAALLMVLSWGVYTKPYIFKAVASRMDSRIMVLFPTFGGQIDFLTPSENIGDSDHPIYLDPILSEKNVEAANIRLESIEAQYKLSKQNPVVGWGLGKNLDGIRQDGKTEYMYWDLQTKIGLVGLVLFGIVTAYYPMKLMKDQFLRRRRTGKANADDPIIDLSFALSAGLFSVAATSYVNPYLASPLGLSILLVTLSACNLVCREMKTEKKLRDTMQSDVQQTSGSV